VRRHLAWPIALPLAAVSALAGHAAGFSVVAPDAHTRAHLLEQTGHGYFAYLPMAVGVGLALALLGFTAAVAKAVRQGPGQRRATAPVWLVVMLPPLAFVLQEHVERYSRHGQMDWTTALENAFVAGLVIQIPFAMLTALVVQMLSRLADGIASLIVSAAPPSGLRRGGPRLAIPIAIDVPRAPILARGYASRPPPPRR
jgi:hypothetical protein